MRRAAARGVLAAGGACALSALVLGWIVWIGGPEALRARYGAFAPLISLAVHTLTNVTPAADLVPWGVANGAIYGVALGSVLSWLSFVAGSAIQLALVRCAAVDLEPGVHVHRLPGWLQRLPVDHPVFLIAGRWVPAGTHLVSVAAGASGVAFGRVMWCSAIAAAPAALLLAAAGAGLLTALTSAG